MPSHLVDYEIRWKNYRGFEDTDWLTIRPITILIGPNNSGKTSIFSPLLLLNQTWASRDASSPLLTRGPLINCGSFVDIVHNHDASKPLFLGVRFHVHKLSETTGELEAVENYLPGAVEMTLTHGGQWEDVILSRLDVFDLFCRPYISHIRNEDGTYAVECSNLGELADDEKEAIKRSTPVNFFFDPSEALRAYRRISAPDEDSVPPKYSDTFASYLRTVDYTRDGLRDFFFDLSYVGPLRERFRRYYEIAGEIPSSVGSSGENTANLIRRTIDFSKRELNKWIREFELGTRLSYRDMPESLFSLYFESQRPTIKTNIADAGFGASQVLPLIVQAVMARADSLTIAEQPEIHLNPRLQGLLADVFVSMAEADQRVLVETHSEHLLLRLRRLVAERRIDADQIAIYYVEKKDGRSVVRQIDMRGNGNVPSGDWPKGFFEDSLRESLALAQAQARRT